MPDERERNYELGLDHYYKPGLLYAALICVGIGSALIGFAAGSYIGHTTNAKFICPVTVRLATWLGNI
jgi:hypothetical protein